VVYVFMQYTIQIQGSLR